MEPNSYNTTVATSIEHPLGVHTRCATVELVDLSLDAYHYGGITKCISDETLRSDLLVPYIAHVKEPNAVSNRLEITVVGRFCVNGGVSLDFGLLLVWLIAPVGAY